MRFGKLFRICLVAAIGTLVLPAAAAAQSCDELSREKVEQHLADGMTPEEITAMYEPCLADAALPTAKQSTTPTGSVFWEEIDACGYHPQRRELECAVEVKQRFGFSGTPPGTPGWNGPGSWEWIIFCVDYGAGLVPVNVSAVHVHDEPWGVNPSWYYGVAVAADPTLHATLVNGQTLRARAILSWTVLPNSCTFNPPWGNQADFKIKLDP